jgi:hypothetical protein
MSVMLRHHHAMSGRLAANHQLLRCHTCTPLSYNTHSARRHVQTNVFDKFKDLVSQFGSEGQEQQQQGKAADYQPEADADGAEMVRIDTDSRGGLGGTTESVFGPLVRKPAIHEAPRLDAECY